MNRGVRVAAILLLAVVLLPAVLSACPLCADAKSNTDYPGGGASLPKGFYYSILFMVAAPFTVMGSFVLRVVLARRRLRAQSAGESLPSELPMPSGVPDPEGARP